MTESSTENSEELYMCDYEKQRLENIRRNQEMLKQLGFTVKNPVSSKPASKKRLTKKRSDTSYRPVSCSETDSEEEWSLWREQQERKTRRRVPKKKTLPLDNRQKLMIMQSISDEVDQRFEDVFNPQSKSKPRARRKISAEAKPTGKVPEYFDEMNESEFEGFQASEVLEEIPDFWRKQMTMQHTAEVLFRESDCLEAFEGFTKEQVGETLVPMEVSQVRNYPKRDKPRKDYEEEIISDEDEYLYCEDCGDLHHGDCPIHGPLGSLDSDKGLDQNSRIYTNVPVPAELTVKTSSIPDAGLGVFAKEYIPRNVKVGPYQGKRVLPDDMDSVEDTSYIWEICRDGQKAYYIDGRKPEDSNWLRFVNCARCEDEQNMVAFQHCGEIYYRTYKHIYPGDELLVWYGEDYARDLGIALLPGMIPSYKCKGCGSLFVENQTFQLHLRHTKSCARANPQIFKCGRCQETFCELYLLQHHIRNHEEFRPSSTDTMFKDKENCPLPYTIKMLENPITDGETKPTLKRSRFKCQYCDYKTDFGTNYQSHVRTHTGEKPFSCDYCGERFAHKSVLTTHLRTHTGEKPFSCDYCGERFAYKSVLTTHLRTHTGEKPFSCDYCVERFAQKGALTIHLRTHTGEKPFSCDYCGETFAHKGNLTRHLRTHTGEKPFNCDYCGETFACKGNLTTHLRTHTGEKPFSCDYCGKTFARKSSLNYHLRTHHSNKCKQ